MCAHLCSVNLNNRKMKKLVIVMIVGLSSSLTFAQKVKESEVPMNVKAAFTTKYADAKEVTWEKEDQNYEVGFEVGELEYSVLYSNDAKFIEEEIEIAISELPKSVIEYMTKNYPSQKIKEAAKIIDATGKVSYEAEIKGKDILFDDKGLFLKEIKE